MFYLRPAADAYASVSAVEIASPLESNVWYTKMVLYKLDMVGRDLLGSLQAFYLRHRVGCVRPHPLLFRL